MKEGGRFHCTHLCPEGLICAGVALSLGRKRGGWVGESRHPGKGACKSFLLDFSFPLEKKSMF